VAWRLGYIDDQQLKYLARPLSKNGYGQYLMQLLEDTSHSLSPSGGEGWGEGANSNKPTP